MCGVFTIISKAKTRNQRRKLRRIAMELGVLNEKRGDHSWGLWSNDFPITKEVGPISKAWKFYQRVNNWNAREGGFIAGHTRWATHGSINKDNAHPFLIDGLIMAHNGIVDVDGYEKAHDVDSGQLAHAIAAEGFVSAIAKTSGSMGLILTHGESMPRIYRSDQELAWVDIGFGWIVSSSKFHIDDALEASGLKVKLSDITSVPEEILQSPWDESFVPVEAIAKPQRWDRSLWGGCGYTGVNNYKSYGGYSQSTISDLSGARGGYTWDHKKQDWVTRQEDGNEEVGWHPGLQKFISIHDPIWEGDDIELEPTEVMCDWCGEEFDMDDAMEVMIEKAIEKCPDFVSKRDCMCRACITDAYRLTFQGRNNLRLEELEKELVNILAKEIHTISDVTRRSEIESEIESLRDRNATIDRALNLRWGTEEMQTKKEVTA